MKDGTTVKGTRLFSKSYSTTCMHPCVIAHQLLLTKIIVQVKQRSLLPWPAQTHT